MNYTQEKNVLSSACINVVLHVAGIKLSVATYNAIPFIAMRPLATTRLM